MSTAYAKLEDHSPFLKHLKNYPVVLKAQKFFLSFTLISSFVEFVSYYTFNFKVFVKDHLPRVSEFFENIEKFFVDVILIKYVDVYLPFIKQDYHVSDITDNKYIGFVKDLPGIQAIDNLITDIVGLVNRNFIITLGKLVNNDIGKEYKQADSLSRELYTSLLLVDHTATSVKNLLLSAFGKSTSSINGAVLSVKDTAAKLTEAAAGAVSSAGQAVNDEIEPVVQSGSERVTEAVNGVANSVNAD